MWHLRRAPLPGYRFYAGRFLFRSLSMIGFYIEAAHLMNGRQIELRVYRGSRAHKEGSIGSLAFAPDEWECFRPVIVGGMRAAGYLRIPIEFMDGTRRKPAVVN